MDCGLHFMPVCVCSLLVFSLFHFLFMYINVKRPYIHINGKDSVMRYRYRGHGCYVCTYLSKHLSELFTIESLLLNREMTRNIDNFIINVLTIIVVTKLLP